MEFTTYLPYNKKPHHERFFLRKDETRDFPYPHRTDNAFSVRVTKDDPLDLFELLRPDTPLPLVKSQHIGFDTYITQVWVQTGDKDFEGLPHSPLHDDDHVKPFNLRSENVFKEGHVMTDVLRLFIEPGCVYSWDNDKYIFQPEGMVINQYFNHVAPELEVHIHQKTGMMHVEKCNVRAMEGNNQTLTIVGFSLNVQMLYSTEKEQE